MIEPINDLRIFLQIMDSGSQAEAARALRLSNAQISKRLSLLEDRMGLKLLHRTTRSFRLTDEGQKLAVHAKRILAEIDDAESAMRDDQLSGSLHITAPAGFGRKFVAPVLFDFMKTNSNLRVQLSLSDRMDDLVESAVDLAIRIYQPSTGNEIAKKLATNRRVFVAAPDYLKANGVPKVPKDLVHHACLSLHNEREWELEKGGQIERIRIVPKMTTGTGEVLREAALAGMGISLKSEWDVADLLESSRLVQVLTDWESTRNLGIYAVFPPNPPKRVRSFLDHLMQTWSPNPPWHKGKKYEDTI